MKVLAVVNMKGGVAKTTLSVNVADFLARRENVRVLLVDLDPQFNATQCLLSGERYVELRKAGAHTIYDLFNDQPAPAVDLVDGISEATPVGIEAIKPTGISENFDLLLGDLQLYRLEIGGGQGREQRLKRLLERFAKENAYDLVLIDTPPTPSAWMTAALIASDAYLVPVKPEPLSRVGIDLLRGIVNRCSANYGLSLPCCGVVLTIAEEHTIVYKDTVTFLDENVVWKGKRFAAPLPKRTAIARDQAAQVLILDTNASDAKTALSKIAREIRDRLEL